MSTSFLEPTTREDPAFLLDDPVKLVTKPATVAHVEPQPTITTTELVELKSDSTASDEMVVGMSEIAIDQKDDYVSDSKTIDGEETEEILRMRNVHKTYLLGLEGVPALRG